MPITFKCECGEQISVPDGMEGRIALCGSCRKTQRIPDGPPEEDDSSVSGLFREALAAFSEGAEGEGADAGAAKADAPSEADTRLMDGRKRSGGSDAAEKSPPPEPGEPPSAVKAALEGGPEADEDSEEIDFAEEIDFSEAPEDPGAADASEDAHATSEVRPPASAGRGGERPPKRGGKRDADDRSSDDEGGPATKDALPVEYAAKVLEQREIEKAIRREGEPDSPAGAFEPKDVELHGNVMKFHCRCGKRISVPVDAGKTMGRCPQCGARLVVPKASHAKLPIPEQAPEPKAKPEPKPKSAPGASKDADAKPAPRKRPKDAKKKAGSDEARAENVRRATAEVADRLRKRGAKKGKGKGKGKGASPGSRGGGVRASGPARVMAAAADAAPAGAALVGSFYLLGGGEWTAEGVVPASVLCVAAWCANRIVVQWIFGSSIGMMAGGVRLARPDGRPLSFGANLVRAFAGLLLVPLSPVAIWDKGRRTPADRAAGTVVLSSR
ncbi:MAG: RDD family protein [Planctomycetota bacterium]